MGPLRKKVESHKMREAKDKMVIKGGALGDVRVPLGRGRSLFFHAKQPSFREKPTPWVIRFTMSSPDVVPRSKDSQRNKENPRGFCLFCFVLVLVKFWRGNASKWFRNHKSITNSEKSLLTAVLQSPVCLLRVNPF